MHIKQLHRVAISLLGSIGMLLCLFSLAEAAVTVQALSGTVEVLLEGETVWESLPEKLELQKGDQIRTGERTYAIVLCDESSIIRLEENTQLILSKLESSEGQKTRTSQFTMLKGDVSLEVIALNVTRDIFEIETDTLVARAKSSSGFVTLSKKTSQTDVIVKQGRFEVQQTHENTTHILGFIDIQEGIMLPLNAAGSKISLEIENFKHKTRLESNIPLSKIQPLTGDDMGVLKISNFSKTPLLVHIQENTMTLEEEEQTTFVLPTDQKIFLESTGKAGIILEFIRREMPSEERREERIIPPPPEDSTPKENYYPLEAPEQPIGSPILPE